MNIEQYYDKIYRYCYFKVHDKVLAEDLTQETFLRFLNAESRQPDRYLYTIAKNLCIDEYRKKRDDGPLPEEMPDGKQTDFDRNLSDKLDLQRALAALPEADRELLILRFVNEEPIGTIAKFLGTSRFSVYRRLKEAKGALKEVLIRSGYEG